MEKIQLVVFGLSPISVPPNSCALILKELNGSRSLPIIIGLFEANAIALEIEGSQPPRPMTHDLIKTLIYSTNITLTEVFISDLKDGTFFSRLIFDEEGIEIDCRPSDAVAIAMRCDAPIFVNEDILDEVGLISQVDENYPDGLQTEAFSDKKNIKTKYENLQIQLEKAINNEDYETAARIRDEIKYFLDSQ